MLHMNFRKRFKKRFSKFYRALSHFKLGKTILTVMTMIIGIGFREELKVFFFENPMKV